MFAFIIKRLLITIPMLLGIALITFLVMRLAPGDYFDQMFMDPNFSPDVMAYYKKLYRLDQPAFVQFWYWLVNLFHFEFGFSFHYNIEVSKVLGGRLWNTFVLSFASFLFTWMVAIPIGIWAAVHRNRFIDRAIQFISYIFLALPSFFLAMILLYWSSQTGVFPLGGMYSPNHDELSMWGKFWDVMHHLAIPTLALSIGSIAALQRIMRGNMLEVLGQQYIMAARAKGLPENRVIYHHALRNAINPLITLLGYEFSALLSGAAIIEMITSWPGLGSLMLAAVRSKDIYLVMATMLMGSLMFMIGNLLADIALAKADPRIRYEK